MTNENLLTLRNAQWYKWWWMAAVRKTATKPLQLHNGNDFLIDSYPHLVQTSFSLIFHLSASDLLCMRPYSVHHRSTWRDSSLLCLSTQGQPIDNQWESNYKRGGLLSPHTHRQKNKKTRSENRKKNKEETTKFVCCSSPWFFFVCCWSCWGLFVKSRQGVPGALLPSENKKRYQLNSSWELHWYGFARWGQEKYSFNPSLRFSYIMRSIEEGKCYILVPTTTNIWLKRRILRAFTFRIIIIFFVCLWRGFFFFLYLFFPSCLLCGSSSSLLNMTYWSTPSIEWRERERENYTWDDWIRWHRRGASAPKRASSGVV